MTVTTTTYNKTLKKVNDFKIFFRHRIEHIYINTTQKKARAIDDLCAVKIALTNAIIYYNKYNNKLKNEYSFLTSQNL